ncbi:MAG: hypothetical protein VB835_08160 [Pirellulales bacterium]
MKPSKSARPNGLNFTLRLIACTNLMVAALPACYAAKSFQLSARHTNSDLENVSVSYEVGGELKIPGEGQSITVPVQVTSELVFQQRFLTIDHEKSPFGQSKAGRGELVRIGAIRNYDRVKTNLKINERLISPELRPARQLISAVITNGELTLFSPNGTLTRDELDLLSLPADRLVVDLLLPQKSVEVGSRWRHDDKTIAMLLGFDAVNDNGISSELKEVTSRYATIESSGNVTGAIEGVEANIEMKSRCHFDRRSRRIASFQLVTRENREIGHVTPGVSAVAKLKIRIMPRTQSTRLNDSEITGLSLTPTSALKRCSFSPQHTRFHFHHDRRWHVTEDEKNGTVLRMMDRGDLIAQCNITSVSSASQSKVQSLEQYEKEVKTILGEKFGRLINSRQTEGENGQTIYRVEAAGTVSELKIRWQYFLITDVNDRRASAAFTLEEDLADRFGSGGEAVVKTLVFTKSGPSEQPVTKTPAPIAD